MAWNNLGLCHMETGSPEKARSDLERALELDPGFALPYFNLAELHQKSGDGEGAQAFLEEAHRRGFRESVPGA